MKKIILMTNLGRPGSTPPHFALASVAGYQLDPCPPADDQMQSDQKRPVRCTRHTPQGGTVRPTKQMVI